MTLEELEKEKKEQEAIKKQENEKRLKELLPVIENELKVLCEKHEIAIEAFLPPSDMGIIPAIRIRPARKVDVKKGENPYDAK